MKATTLDKTFAALARSVNLILAIEENPDTNPDTVQLAPTTREQLKAAAEAASAFGPSPLATALQALSEKADALREEHQSINARFRENYPTPDTDTLEAWRNALAKVDRDLSEVTTAMASINQLGQA